jgi:hypothetical protein
VALAAPTGQVHALRQEIAALQLDRTLNLTQQQAQALLPEIQDAKAKVAAFKTQQGPSEPARVAALTQAVADIKASGTVAASTTQALQAARSGTAGTLRQELRSLWQQAQQVLTANQIQELKTVKLGLGQLSSPDAAASSTPHGGRGHSSRRFFVLRTLLSDDFVALVQARAG